MTTLFLIACALALVAMVFLGVSVLWWLLLGIVKLVLFILAGLFSIGLWLVALPVIVVLLFLKLTGIALVLGLFVAVGFVVWLALGGGKSRPRPVCNTHHDYGADREAAVEDCFARIERRLHSVERIARDHTYRY